MLCSAEKLEQIQSNSQFHDIGPLPSQFIPYRGRPGKPSMEKMFIRPLQLAEMRLISKSIQLQSKLHLMRAIDNCISHPVGDLSIGDFYYVLLWQRIYSMPKRPYVFEWKCDQEFFRNKETRQPLFYDSPEFPTREKLLSDYTHSPCDTENTCIVSQSVVTTYDLAEDLVLPEGFDFPRAAILDDRDAAAKDPEMTYLWPGVQWIAGDTWEEKMARAEKDFELFQTGMDLQGAVNHGVAETVEFKCRQCHVKHVQDIEIDAFIFFQ